MPATISTDIERPNMPVMGGPTWVDVTVEPGPQQGSVRRQVLLVVDRSGSMCGPKLRHAKNGAKRVLGLLDDEDYVGVISFDSEVDVTLTPAKYGDLDRVRAVDRIEDIEVGGGTNIYSAIDRAMGQFERLPTDRNTVRRILLLTDGRDNHREPAAFTEQARQADERGIRIMAAGLGDRYSEETVRSLGVASRGQWSHLEDAGDVHSFYEERLRGASTVVAPDARLELDLEPGVEVTDVYRERPRTQEVDVEPDGDAATIRLPDLLERQRQTIKLRLVAPERTVGSTITLADVTLRAAGTRTSDAITVRYSDENDQLADRETRVWTESKETVIRAKAGRGSIEDAETELETLVTAVGDSTLVDDVEEIVTTVDKGGRKERYETTIVEE